MAGWGRVHKEQLNWTVIDGRKKGSFWDPVTNMKEACVPIVDINDCRNNYIVHYSKNSKYANKKKVMEPEGQIDWVYDGINICAGSSSKDSCQVRFIVYFQLSGTQLMHQLLEHHLYAKSEQFEILFC